MADFARSDSAAVQAQLDRLAKLSPGGDQLGLDRISRLLERLDRPQDRLPPVFHIAGTNGKGSTCAFLRAVLEAAGHHVHVFTSPHLVRFNERIRIAGKLIDDDRLAALLAEVLDAGDGIEASFFEVTTAVAFLAFARSAAEACVVEVGLGGRLDATNVLEQPLMCGITHLGLDHQQFLGSRLIDVAGEKAGIAKQGAPLVTQLYPRTIARRIEQTASEVGARWLPRGSSWDARVRGGRLRYRDDEGVLDLPLPRLAGPHQPMNAALAIAMLRHQHRLTITADSLCAGITDAIWPGRLQRLGSGPLANGREVWVDGGHNPAAAASVAQWARRQFGPGGLDLVFASLESKDAAGVLEPFKDIVTHVSCVAIPGHESRSPEELVEIAAGFDMSASAHASLAEAVATTAADRPLLIFGSLYLAGEALKANGEAPD